MLTLLLQNAVSSLVKVVNDVPEPIVPTAETKPPLATKVVISSAQTVVVAGVTVTLDGEALTVTVTVTLVVIVPSTAVTV